jgi:hypothetical protein
MRSYPRFGGPVSAQLRQHKDSRSFSREEKFVPEGQLKVAQHFSAGLAFFDTTVLVGPIDFRCRSPKNGPTSYLSIVPTGTVVFFRN